MSRIVPELDVSDLEISLDFYTRICKFEIRYRRPEEQFVMLAVRGAELMLQSAEGSGRRFRSAALEQPFGRGMNLQIEVDDIVALHGRAVSASASILIPIEDKWYQTDDGHVGNRQLVVEDPDGYLLRFFQDIGTRPS